MTFFESSSRSNFLFEHDLFGKPLHTFPDHALGSAGLTGISVPVALCTATVTENSDFKAMDGIWVVDRGCCGRDRFRTPVLGAGTSPQHFHGVLDGRVVFRGQL